MRILISTSATATLYHFTSVLSAIKALTEGMMLTPTSLTDSDSAHGKRKAYFLSLTRSRHGRYHRNDSRGVLFELDGTKINTRYQVKPVDYWQFFSSPKLRFDSDEQEERLVTDKPRIDIKPFLKSISLLVDESKTDKRTLRTLYVQAFKLGIPLYLYNDPKLFQMGREKGRLQLSDVVDVKKAPQRTPSRDRGFETLLSSALHLLMLTDDPEFNLYNDVYDVKGFDKSMISYLRYGDDLKRQLKAAFQNAGRSATTGLRKDRARLDRLIAAMRKRGLMDVKDYVKFIMDRRDADQRKFNAARAQTNDGW